MGIYCLNLLNLTNKVIYVLRFCSVLHVILFAQKLMEVTYLPKLMDSILSLMGYHDNTKKKYAVDHLCF